MDQRCVIEMLRGGEIAGFGDTAQNLKFFLTLIA
jgi:hypothetical protein